MNFRWFGKCWYIHDLLKYEFEVEFDVSKIVFPNIHYCHGWDLFSAFTFTQIPVTYPVTAPEVAIPELDGKTAKMYR